MIQMFSGIALLAIFIIPIIILFVVFYQNLLESMKFKTKKQVTRRRVYKNNNLNNTSEREETRLRVVK